MLRQLPARHVLNSRNTLAPGAMQLLTDAVARAGDGWGALARVLGQPFADRTFGDVLDAVITNGKEG